MPKKSNRQIKSLNAISHRWPDTQDDVSMQISDDDEEKVTGRTFLEENIEISVMCDIFQWCQQQCSRKDLSVLLYVTLRRFGIGYDQIDLFLKEIGALTAQVAYKWASVFVSADLDEYCIDGRGGQRGDAFYDIYPETESEAKAFSIVQCQQKSASFTALDLAKFIDEKYCQINDLDEARSDLIRAIGSCRLDLRKWGARFEENGQRPYFEGHERLDVVAERERFVHYFLKDKGRYYTVRPGEDPKWILPSGRNKKILICKIKWPSDLCRD